MIVDMSNKEHIPGYFDPVNPDDYKANRFGMPGMCKVTKIVVKPKDKQISYSKENKAKVYKEYVEAVKTLKNFCKTSKVTLIKVLKNTDLYTEYATTNNYIKSSGIAPGDITKARTRQMIKLTKAIEKGIKENTNE